MCVCVCECMCGLLKISAVNGSTALSDAGAVFVHVGVILRCSAADAVCFYARFYTSINQCES